MSTLTLLDREPQIVTRPAPSLRADGITAGYGGVPVIRGISIAAGPSEIVAVIGPNGAGKSTLLKSLIGILRVTSGYGGVPVIRDVSIAVGPEEIVAVIGPNGAGKSTLLKSLIGILRVTQGRVLLGDQDVTNHPPEELARRGVGYVPQVNDIFEPLTVLENLEMGGYLLAPARIRHRVEEVGQVFPALPPMFKRRADKLSGGERKNSFARTRTHRIGP